MLRRPTLGITLILLVVALVVGIAACAPAPAKPTTPATTPTTTPPVQPKEFKLAAFGPKSAPTLAPVQAMCDSVGKYTNGSLTIKLYGVGEIAETKDLPELTRTGAIDMSATAPVYYPSLFPIGAALQQQLILHTSPDMAIYTFRHLLAEFPEIQNEYAKQNQYVLNRASLGTYYTLSKSPIRNLDDAKGMKIRNSGGKLTADYTVAAGATSVFVPPADYYEGLMRGVYDAFTGDQTQMYGFKLFENAKYLQWRLGTYTGWHIAMNLDKWKSLSASEQQAVTKAATEWGAADLAVNKDFDVNGRKLLESKGVQWVEFTDYDKVLANFGEPWAKQKQTMITDLKIDPAFVEKFVNRWKALTEEYEAKYTKTSTVWKYE